MKYLVCVLCEKLTRGIVTKGYVPFLLSRNHDDLKMSLHALQQVSLKTIDLFRKDLRPFQYPKIV